MARRSGGAPPVSTSALDRSALITEPTSQSASTSPGRTTGPLLVERALHDLDDPVELDEELGKCPVPTAWTEWTPGHRCVSNSGRIDFLARDLLETRQLAFNTKQSHPFDEIRDGGQCLRRQVIGRDALEPRPQGNGCCGRNQAGHGPAADARRNDVYGSRDGDGDHESEEHPEVGRGDIAAEDATERDYKTNHQHHGYSQPR